MRVIVLSSQTAISPKPSCLTIASFRMRVATAAGSATNARWLNIRFRAACLTADCQLETLTSIVMISGRMSRQMGERTNAVADTLRITRAATSSPTCRLADKVDIPTRAAIVSIRAGPAARRYARRYGLDLSSCARAKTCGEYEAATKSGIPAPTGREAAVQTGLAFDGNRVGISWATASCIPASGPARLARYWTICFIAVGTCTVLAT